nr:nitrate ABC transporter substrate-binding protein [Streptomyces acidiscabies]
MGATGWKVEEAALKFANLDNTPYHIKWSTFQGGDKQLEAVRAGALDLASSSEIPPVFAAADGKPNFKVVAVQSGSTLNQEVVVPNDGLAALNGGSIDAFASYGTSIITAHQQGATTIGSGADILSGNFLWSARDSVLKSAAQKEAAADLIARISKAYAYVRDGHEAEFAKVIARNTHQPVAQAETDLVAQQKQRPTAARPVDAAATASEQKVADVFTELGALGSRLDVASFWTTDLDAELEKSL